MAFLQSSRFVFSKVLFFVFMLAFSGVTAFADSSCDSILKIIDAAPSEFENFYGDRLELEIADDMDVFEGTFHISSEYQCSIAQQNWNGRRFSTSYTCGFVASDVQNAVAQLKVQLSDCLDVEDWFEQGGSDVSSVSVAQYGLLRLSISQHSDNLGFGVEVFRDEADQVVGSPHRGDQKQADGSQLCIPRKSAEIKALYEIYASQPGAEPFVDDQFYGVTNREMSPMVAFVTRPTHPAHPAIITRRISEDGRRVHASGDFAGDCLAFHGLLVDVIKMNESMGND